MAGQNRTSDTLPFTPYHLFEFATGNISNCFGPDFDVYKGALHQEPLVAIYKWSLALPMWKVSELILKK